MFNSVFGNLRISDIPYHDPIILTAGAFMLLLGTVFFWFNQLLPKMAVSMGRMDNYC